MQDIQSLQEVIRFVVYAIQGYISSMLSFSLGAFAIYTIILAVVFYVIGSFTKRSS